MKFLAAALLLLGLLAASASAVADSVDLTFAFLAQTNATTCVRGTGTVLPVHLDNDRWKLEANIAVQAATLVGQLWDPDLQTNDDFDDLLYAIVTSNVRSRQMIYGSAIAFVKDGYRDGVRLFAPYAFRRNAGVSSIDLSRRYDYTTSDSEWFYKVLEDSKNKQLNTAYTRREGGRDVEQCVTLSYEDGAWSDPYFDCGAGNIWMITYSIPFYKCRSDRERRVFAAWGVATIDVNLNHVDINQCPAPHALKHRDDPFIGTHRCHSLSTKCEPVAGRGFRSGGYRCSCRKGFYSNLVEIDPETNVETPFKAFDGYQIEKEFAKSKRKLDNTYDSLTCLKCQPHCDECVDDTPCLSWISRKLMLAFCIIVGICWLLALIFLIMIWMKRNNVVIKISNVIILSLIIIGACMMLAEVILASYEPTKKLCHASIWMYTEGFVLAYTALIVKAYREVTVCRSGYIGKARANDKWHYLVIAIAVIVFTIFMAICTARAPILPQVFVQSADHKYLMCDHSWWAWTVTIVEYLLVFFAGVAISLHTVAKRVTYLEPRFISRLLIIFPIILLCIFIIGALNRGQWYVHANYVIIFAKVMVAATLMLICVFGYKFYLLQHAPEESNEWKHGDEQPVTVTSGRPVHGETNRTMHENGSRL